MDFTQQSGREFVRVLAGKDPVPGGGGASAFVGAIGTALGNMVGSLTVGKKKYADVQEDIVALKAQADTLQDELLQLVCRDAEVFEPLSRAYGMPKDTEEQKQEKERVMEAALKEACAVPLQIMQACCKAIDLHEDFEKKGTAIAISDVGVGVVMCKAALQGASLNVFINTKIMKDREHAQEANKNANEMLQSYCAKADEIYARVCKRFD